MKNIILILFAIILQLSHSHSYAQGKNVQDYFQHVYPQNPNAGKIMPKEKENLLLSLYPPQIKEKLEELKKLSLTGYQKMLWELTVFVPSDLDKSNNYLLNEVVTTSGPASPEQIKREILEIDVEILTFKIKNSKSHDSNQLKSQLLSALYQLFDYSTSRRQTRLQRLEEQLTELKNKINTLNKKRDEIVNAKLNELLK